MFHGKPLYVAIAQRKEDRKAQLQLRFEQSSSKRVPSTMIQQGYPFYYTPTVVSPHQGFFHQPLGMNQMWQSNGFASTRHQPIQSSLVNAVSITNT